MSDLFPTPVSATVLPPAADTGPTPRERREQYGELYEFTIRAEPRVFELPVPMVVQLKKSIRPLTHNDRMHWRPKAKKVKEIREAVAEAAGLTRIPAARHITVTLHYRPGGRSVTDSPNLTATSKPAIDGLVDAEIVPDDTDKHVTERMPVIHPGPGERRLWLTVEVTR